MTSRPARTPVRSRGLSRSLVSLFFLLFGLLAIQPATASPQAVLYQYLEAAADGNWDRAATFWHPADRDRARRLGVTYQDVPFKLDCASPVSLSPVGSDPLILRSEAWGRVQVLTVGRIVAGDTLTAIYHLLEEADTWRLVAPTTAVGGDWPVSSSRFLRFHIQPGRRLSEPARAGLDSFVQTACGQLGISDTELRHLMTAKIDYYFGDAASVARIAGAPTRGVAMLGVDAVATSEPFHQHELAHLLVNYAVQHLPLYTLPVLQEGLAVHLGGRWGRSPRVMAELGRFVLGSGFIEVTDLLTGEGFRRELPDLTYAPAGVVAGFLLGRLGPTEFRNLYRALSGDFAHLMTLDSATVRRELESRLGLSPGGLEAALADHAEGIPRAGFAPAGSWEGEPFMTLTAQGATAVIHLAKDWVRFEIQLSGDVDSGVISLIPVTLSESGAVPTNRLFQETLPGMTCSGERAALVFKAREAGLYDFDLAILVAKYVEDFRALPGYQAGPGRPSRFRVRRDLFPARLEDFLWRLQTLRGQTRPGG